MNDTFACVTQLTDAYDYYNASILSMIPLRDDITSYSVCVPFNHILYHSALGRSKTWTGVYIR